MARFARAEVDLVGGSAELEGQAHSLTHLEQRALAYFHAHRELLVTRDELEREVWGFRAGVRSKAVPVAIRRLRAKLGPDAIHTVHGKGWRVDAEPKQVTPRQLTGIARTAHPLFGRQQDLTKVAALLRTAGRVLLTGPPGVGKTRLATEVAASHDGPVLDVPADGCTRSEQLWPSLANALQLASSRPDRILRKLAEGSPPLLLLDATEGLTDLEDFLALLGDAAVKVLITSRRWNHLQGVPVHHVQPFPPEEARAFLVERLRDHHWDPEAEGERLDALVRAVDGLPGALELYAGRAVLGVQFVLDDLKSAGVTSDLTQQLERSWTVLSEDARQGLLHLRAFRGLFPVDAALASTTAPVLAELRAGSLLSASENGMHLLEVVRSFCALQPGTAAASARTHLWVLERGERWVAQVETQPRRALEELRSWRRTHLDIMTHGTAEHAARAALLLTASARFSDQEGLELAMLERVAEQTPEGPLRNQLRIAQAHANRIHGTPPEDILSLLEGLELPEALLLRGHCVGSTGDSAGAVTLYRQVIEVAPESWMAAWAAARLGSQQFSQHVPPAEGQAYLRGALELCQKHGWVAREAHILGRLATALCRDGGGIAAARPLFQRALAIAEDQRLDHAIMTVWGLLGMALFPDDLPASIAAFRQAEAGAIRVGIDPATHSYTLNVGLIAFLLDEVELALASVERLDTVRRYPSLFIFGTAIRGAALLSAGRTEEGRAALAWISPRQLNDSLGVPVQVAEVWVDLLKAEEHLQRGEHGPLKALLERAEPLLPLDSNGVLRCTFARMHQRLK